MSNQRCEACYHTPLPCMGGHVGRMAEAPPEPAAESCGQCECCEAWRATHDEALADVARLTAENAALKAKLDATTDDFGCVPVSFSSVIDGIDSRQTQEAVENLVVWHMRRAEKAEAERDAALATATEAAATVARLTAERDDWRKMASERSVEIIRLMAERDTLDCTRREGGDTRHCRVDRKCQRCALESEVQRLSVQVQHCENCGGDYAVTGLSSTCGCEIRAQTWAEAVQVVEQVAPIDRGNRDWDAACASVLAALRAAQGRTE